jgi:alpha-glucosidase
MPARTAADPAHEPWWRRAVVYEVYLRSFADADGDGVGDIAGLRSRLPHLVDLGVDAIWITPWYRSPNADGGYDVADFRDIDPRYGDLAQAEALIAEVHQLGLRVIIDVVPNHTSDQHVWFQQAVAAPPGHPARRRYEIHPGLGPDGDRPPSDWRSVFGGSAWQRLPDGEWYLHLFAPEQPDLNWDHPEVREEFESVLRFWLDRGVDGIRVDVAHGLVKDKSFPSSADDPRLLDTHAVANHPFWDRDEVHDIVRGWRRVLDGYAGERMMVAEAWVQPERLADYLRPDEYHQSFNFALLDAEWDAAEWRGIIERSLAAAVAVGSTPTWTLANHDVMRHATRYGLPRAATWREWLVDGPASALDEAAGHRRALAATAAVLALPGSTYLYQGEELGLPEVWDLPPEVLDDPVQHRSGGRQKGRDGCRVPLPWSRTGPSFGFGPGPAWLPQPSGFGARSVEAQVVDETSALALYRRAIALRRRHAPADAELTWLDLGGRTVAFRRSSGLTSITTVGTAGLRLPPGELLLSTRPVTAGRLPGEATAWLLTPAAETGGGASRRPVSRSARPAGSRSARDRCPSGRRRARA